MKRYIKSSTHETRRCCTKHRYPYVVLEEPETYDGDAFGTQERRKTFYEYLAVFLDHKDIGEDEYAFVELHVNWDEAPGSPMRFDIKMHDYNIEALTLNFEVPYNVVMRFLMENKDSISTASYYLANYLTDIVTVKIKSLER